MHFQSLRYLAGFIAHKFLQDFPHLGQRTHCAVNYDGDVPDWIRAISRGGLLIPSESFTKQVQEFEKCFVNFSGATDRHTCVDSISKLKNEVIRQCVCSLLDEHVVMLYARTRCFIRLRYMNSGHESARLRRKGVKKVATVL
jgi:hypothetical protein